MGSQITELENLSFLSNSGAHSPWPYRIGREFNRFNTDKEISDFETLQNMIVKGPKQNVGLDPREGKYHLTAYNSCYKKYSLIQAQNNSWRCECGSTIKKGVN